MPIKQDFFELHRTFAEQGETSANPPSAFGPQMFLRRVLLGVTLSRRFRRGLARQSVMIIANLFDLAVDDFYHLRPDRFDLWRARLVSLDAEVLPWLYSKT